MNKSLKYKWSIGAKQRLKTQRNSFTYIKSISGPNSQYGEEEYLKPIKLPMNQLKIECQHI